MTKTAYSSHYKSELDPEQLLARLTSTKIEAISTDIEITPEVREWVKKDITCPFCGVTGAQIIRPAKAKKTGVNVRQPHFRFTGASGEDAHRKYCELGTNPDVQTSGALINFANARSKETRFVRKLVCQGIENNFFNQKSIREMRQWFFECQVEARMRIQVTPQAIAWMEKLSHHPSYQKWRFHASHVEMPNFSWRHATLAQFSNDNQKIIEWLFERKKASSFPRAYKRAAELSNQNLSQDIFDATVLKENYELTTELTIIAAQNTHYPINERSQHYRSYDTPLFLTAFCALLLYVSDWDIAIAATKLAQIVSAPPPKDETLGNLIGLNPFHDYEALETLKIATELAELSPNGLDYDAQLQDTELRMQKEYELWKASY